EGGGDAVSAARAVIQTGEYDFAWNVQVEDDILRRMEQGGKGRVDVAVAGNIEHIQCNQTDPWKEVDGERASVKAPHPFLTDPAVRQALNLLVDRASVRRGFMGAGDRPRRTSSTRPRRTPPRTPRRGSMSTRPTRSTAP